MTPGRLIAVVGPSGVGKDSVMAHIAAQEPRIKRAHRTITRAPGLGGEAYHAVTPDAFAQAVAAGAFCLHWRAHGLSYGIPMQVRREVQSGSHVIANLSRRVLPEAAALFASLVVLSISAAPEVLTRRLKARGRESPQDIARRLERAADPLPSGLTVIGVCNDGRLEDSAAYALGMLYPMRAPC